MENPLKQIVKIQKEGKAAGIYSCCSASEYVLRAVLERGARTSSCVLIESTANQCDQYGGYTGMTPGMFRDFVYRLADETGFDRKLLFLGGDHLGPLTFAAMEEDDAMMEAQELIRCYVRAGFTKIHLDTSMRLKGDDPDKRLTDETIAERAALLAKTAEETFRNEVLSRDPNAVEPVYVIGSEVPVPGGQQAGSEELQITDPADFNRMLAVFEETFRNEGLEHAWNNVIAAVVQPGVEERDSGCTEYSREKAEAICEAGRACTTLVLEGHSTDYQTRTKLREMVEDGIAVLKVGPALTFAMREALYALAYCERELYGFRASNFIEVLDDCMSRHPEYWQKHYTGNEKEIGLKRKYSFSDRCRYCMPDSEVRAAKDLMLYHLKDGVPLNLLSQFMPVQYWKVREGILENEPEALIKDRIGCVIDDYLYASQQYKLFRRGGCV